MRSKSSAEPRGAKRLRGRTPRASARREPPARHAPPSRNDQVVRVLQILRDLDHVGGLDLYELAARYGTAVRTIRRDLAALEQAGFPVVSERDGVRKRYRIDFSGALGRLASLLDASHYLALRVAMAPGAPLQNRSSVFATLEDLGAKIERAIGEAGRERLAAIERCFHTHERRAYREVAPDRLWPLVDAISERKLCRVTYRAPRADARDKTFVVLPLQLFTWEGSLYLTAHAPRHDNLLKLNLQRLRDLRVLARRAEPPAGFDPTAFEHAAFGIFVGGAPTHYRLRFDATAAPYIRERVWHPTQELRDLGDGGVELRFHCHASYEVAAWVQGWGEHVVVESPPALRAELARLGAWLGERYGGHGGRSAPAPSARRRAQKS
jgi:proteasome accessory factor B